MLSPTLSVSDLLVVLALDASYAKDVVLALDPMFWTRIPLRSTPVHINIVGSGPGTAACSQPCARHAVALLKG